LPRKIARRFGVALLLITTTGLGLSAAFASIDDPYALSRTVQSSVTLYVAGPLCAAYAAARGAVLVDLWGRVTVRRSLVAVLLERLSAPLAVGALSTVTVFAFRAREATLAAPIPLCLALAGVLAWSLFGAAIGVWVSRIVGVPIALTCSFLALGLPGALEPLWIRHLTGVLSDCCTTSLVLAPRAVSASLAANLAVALISVVALTFRLGPASPRWSFHAVMTSAAVLAMAAGVTQASGLDAFPVEPRDRRDLVCVDSLCLWPEDERARGANLTAIGLVEKAWLELDLPLADVRYGPTRAPGFAAVTTRSSNRSQAIESVAVQFPRALTDCDSYDSSSVAADDWLVVALLQRLGVETELQVGQNYASAADAFAALISCE
jgi:hypothetical protein